MTWPTSRPGYPMHAERDGWHWFEIRGNRSPEIEAACWRAPRAKHQHGMWFVQGNDEPIEPERMTPTNGWLRYLGPCPTPADLDAAVQAEREACATQLDMMRKAHNDALIGQPHTPDTSIAYGNGAAAIRARGPTPALAEALAQARRETWEKAAEIAKAHTKAPGQRNMKDQWRESVGAEIATAISAAAGEEET